MIFFLTYLSLLADIAQLMGYFYRLIDIRTGPNSKNIARPNYQMITVPKAQGLLAPMAQGPWFLIYLYLIIIKRQNFSPPIFFILLLLLFLFVCPYNQTMESFLPLLFCPDLYDTRSYEFEYISSSKDPFRVQL